MRRDWQLLGALLEQIEKETVWAYLDNAGSAERDTALLHMELLADAGYIKDFTLRRAMDGTLSYGHTQVRITMAGYDLKEVITDARLFNQIRQKATDCGVRLSWEFIKAAIPVVIKSLL